jgi:hypothetical protein
MRRIMKSALAVSPESMALIGSRSDYQGRKYLELTRAMGPKKIFEAINLLARADRALRGGTGLEDEIVLEVLVARLSRMMPARQQRGAKRSGARR